MDTIYFLLIIIIFAALFYGVAYLGKSRRRKAEDLAIAALQAVLDHGEQLIEFTKVNTKGASSGTVLLTGAVGAAISRAGGEELYVGLTNNRLVLTPVKLAEGSRSVQGISNEDIKGFDIVGGLHGSSTLTTHTKDGDMVMYIPNDHRWIRRASAIKNAFVDL